MADLAAQIAARIQERLGDPLDAVLDAFAAAIQEEAPQNTGALSMSVQVEPRSSPTEGAIRLKFYGDIVARGIPGARVMGYGGQPMSMPALSESNRAKAARARYAKTVGRTIEHPNDFIQRAWESERVQHALSQFGELTFTRD